MKNRLLVLLLLALFLTGCTVSAPGSKDSVAFYFPRNDFHTGAEDALVSSELRDLAGHTDDLTYCLKMYLVGPTDDRLEASFPKNTRLLSIEQQEETLIVILSDGGQPMQEIRFTVAAACLAKTFLPRVDASQLTVIRGSQSITLDETNVLFLDERTPIEIIPDGGTQ